MKGIEKKKINILFDARNRYIYIHILYILYIYILYIILYIMYIILYIMHILLYIIYIYALLSSERAKQLLLSAD